MKQLTKRLMALLILCLATGAAVAQIILQPLPLPTRPIRPILPNPDDWVEISAGNYDTCARKYNGNVYCWGLNNAGQAGTTMNRTCSGQACVDRPKLVMGAIAKVDVGSDHACTMDSAGIVKCWGYSSYGQLGAGVYGDSSATGPQTVPGRVFTSISAGTFSTCGTTTAGMFCWGKIMNSLYGTPNPTQVFAWNGYDNVTVGHQHACAIYAVGSWREVDCWGYNNVGQTGIDPTQFINVPATLNSSLGIAANRVVTQGDFTCADQVTGIVQCVGTNYYGTLANGGGRNSTFQPQTVGGGMQLSGVTTGSNHACALTPAGLAYCWGNGYSGQVGGPSGEYWSARAVNGGRSYKAIAAGALHTCAIGTDNKIWCWGGNSYGQLGTMYPGGWVTDPVQTLDPI